MGRESGIGQRLMNGSRKTSPPTPTEQSTGRSIHAPERMATGKGVSLIPTSVQPFPAMDRNVPINLE
jgi:hypothetical protein